jgi:hypothetical protein
MSSSLVRDVISNFVFPSVWQFLLLLARAADTTKQRTKCNTRRMEKTTTNQSENDSNANQRRQKPQGTHCAVPLRCAQAPFACVASGDASATVPAAQQPRSALQIRKKRQAAISTRVVKVPPVERSEEPPSAFESQRFPRPLTFASRSSFLLDREIAKILPAPKATPHPAIKTTRE